MLSRFDEYLIHPTPEPLAHPVSLDRNLYDRYWLGGFASDASLYFTVSLGVYPNRQVMDGALSVWIEGEQHCCFASRRALPGACEDTRVGPLSVEVIEPMRALRVVLQPNDSGVSGELEFRAHSACVEEDRQQLRRGRETWMDATRFTQFGRWQGALRVADRRIPVEAARVSGIRDRSWGRRNVGDPEVGAPPAPPRVHFTWVPLLWEDHATIAVFFDDVDGHALHAEGRTVPLYASPDAVPGIEDPGTRRLHGVARSLRYRPGTRWVAEARLSTMHGDGSVETIILEPLLRFQMKGTGYGHPAWRHGAWKGELATGADRWHGDALDPLAPENLHVQQLVRCRSGDRVGLGVLEHLCIGPYAPAGFTGPADGAR